MVDGPVVWLGGRRKATGDGWEWLGGRPWTYQNWRHNQPKNRTGYDCVAMLPEIGWIAMPCHVKLRFICENSKE